jgi:DNA-directed RNA polymerase specialized sigma24 family protein
MTPADEATFIQLWQDGASQQALAARLGIPLGTVKSRINFAKRLLRKALRPLLDDDAR